MMAPAPATNADRVLTLLHERRDGPWSADELVKASGLRPEILSDVVWQLQQDGFHVEHSPANGLQLVGPVKPAPCLIEQGLNTRRIGRSVLCFGEVDSTNDVASDSARQDDTDGLVVTAESQRTGRGRQGRQWLAAAGENLLFSVLLLDSGGAVPHEALTIAAGLSVAEGINDACGVDCRLKWPNDVLLETAKVAGVLVERREDPRPCMILGVGINTNWSPQPPAVDWPATDLASLLDHPVERIDVLRAVLRRLDGWCASLGAGDVQSLHDAWTSRCGMINQRATIESGGVRHTGRVLDVSPLEGLVLAVDSGQCIRLPAKGSTVLE